LLQTSTSSDIPPTTIGKNYNLGVERAIGVLGFEKAIALVGWVPFKA
jgi:hypothetical protein